MPPKRATKTFAFFSQQVHDERSGRFTDEFRNAASGEVTKPNYVGPSIGGYPGRRLHGNVVRPPNYKTYVRVGEASPGKFQAVVRPDEVRSAPRPYCESSRPR